MLLEKSIALLQDFAKQKNNPAFSEFANNLALFIQKHKNTHNINDFKTFVELVGSNIDINNENQREISIASIYFAKEINDNGSIDYERFFQSFINKHLYNNESINTQKTEQEALKIALKNFEQNSASRFEMEIIVKHYNTYFQKVILQEKLDSATQETIQKIGKIVNNKDYEGLSEKEFYNFIKSLIEYHKNLLEVIADNHMDEIQEIQLNNLKEMVEKSALEEKTIKENIDIIEAELIDLDTLTQVRNDKKAEVIRLEQIKSEDNFFNPVDMKKEIDSYTQAASVQAMFSFIRDKKQINFPFSKQDTLENNSFKVEFFKELKSLPPQEIQKLIDEVKAKNQALRVEIEELNNQKATLMQELKAELIDNHKLSEFKEANNKQQEQEFSKNNSKENKLIKDASTRSIGYKKKK